MEATPIIEALSQIGCRSLQHLHPKVMDRTRCATYLSQSFSSLATRRL